MLLLHELGLRAADFQRLTESRPEIFQMGIVTMRRKLKFFQDTIGLRCAMHAVHAVLLVECWRCQRCTSPKQPLQAVQSRAVQPLPRAAAPDPCLWPLWPLSPPSCPPSLLAAMPT